MDDKRYYFKLSTAATLMMSVLSGCESQTNFTFNPNISDQLDTVDQVVKVDPTTTPPTVDPTTTPPTVTPTTVPPVVIVEPTTNPPVISEEVIQQRIDIPQAGKKPADVLFVIDNSGSMSDEQKVVADSFATFISKFVAKDIDFHIGVTTTDITADVKGSWNKKLPKFKYKGPGCLTGVNQRFLSKSSANIVSEFKANAQVGLLGDGAETRAGAVNRFVEAPKLATGGCNEGFLRQDAVLAVIGVSDEDDSLVGRLECSGKNIAECFGVMASNLKNLDGSGSQDYRYYDIADIKATPPKVLPQKRPFTTGMFSYPEFALDASKVFGFPVWDIRANFGELLSTKIAESIVKAAESKSFALNQKPMDVSKIEVRLNGEKLVAGSSDGYVYNAKDNVIELQGKALADSPGSILEISFTVQKVI